jgi:exonuclease III
MTWIYKQKGAADRFIYSLQETHITKDECFLVEALWREGYVIAPSLGKARGVVTVFSNSLFDSVLFTLGSPDGRSTWVVGEHNTNVDLFVSIYSPNSGKNAEFYTSFFSKVNAMVNRFNVDNVYISGDFNLVLFDSKTNRPQSTYEKKLSKIVLSEMSLLGLKCINDCSKHTWNRGNKFSTLDYIFVPRAIADTHPDVEVKWAIDKSDHGSVQAIIYFEIDKGKGMFKPNLAFLDCNELRTSFEAELYLLMLQTNPEWDPHMKLEFAKVMIRTKAAEYSLKFKKQVEDKHNNIMLEINRLQELKSLMCSDTQHALHSFITMDDVDKDLFSLDIDLDKVLQDKTTMLASKSRIKWLELGEKSNKYFLNLNKSFQNKSYYKSFIVDNKEIFDPESKVKAVFDFYSLLYDKRPTDDPSQFLDKLELSELTCNCNEVLSSPLSKEELVKVLKACGDTASGPDGIGYKLLKSCWSFYGDILIDSWNYATATGLLAPSHRESVICLLGKKGKDKRLIGNLRPITLSNCDIKVITKAMTKRCNKIINNVLNPHQTAYIPGRIVHDNLRVIDIVKEQCNNNKIEGYLVSLDAKKAFDSVDHIFIDEVLRKFNFCTEFRNIVKVLYNQITSRVLVNGHLTNNFPILRSVKQGDALSCVLFILCMEVVIKSIKHNDNIEAIRLNGVKIPKVLSYADDIAILVANVQSIKSSIDDYNNFSKYSGLYLNVDKTEIMKLYPAGGPDDVELAGGDCHSRIQFTNNIIICGRAFSCYPALEYEKNVTSKIDNLTKALNSWKRRSLSIFGRNIILKTFGLSQIIYSMQNSHFTESDIKSIERICYNFLWNKKADKTKAYERIARFKLKCPYSSGGINSPDIDSMNRALKAKQLIRSTSVKCLHSIKIVQVQVLGYDPDVLFQAPNLRCANKFVNKAMATLSELGEVMIHEIITSDDNSRLSKNYYSIIASELMINLVYHLIKNPLIRLQARQVGKRLGIKFVGQFINEFKFPSNDELQGLVKNVIQEGGSLLKILCLRKELTYGLCVREFLFVNPNFSVNEEVITTKQLRLRLFNKGTLPENKQDFRMIKKITHPKEREVAFLRLHNALLPNKKLFEMKLINSPLCNVCGIEQTAEHIFLDCTNAKNSVTAYSQLSFKFKHDKSVNSDVKALINRILYMNRNKAMKSDVFCIAINNRLNDLNNILQFKKRKKELLVINKLTLL